MSSTHVCTMFLIERITIALLFLFFLASGLLFKNSPNISAAATASSSDKSILFVYVLLVPVCVMCVTVLVPATGNCLLVPATGTRNRSVWHLLNNRLFHTCGLAAVKLFSLKVSCYNLLTADWITTTTWSVPDLLRFTPVSFSPDNFTVTSLPFVLGLSIGWRSCVDLNGSASGR